MSTLEILAVVCVLFIPGFLAAIFMSDHGRPIPDSEDALIQAKLSDQDIEAYNAANNTRYRTRALAQAQETA